MKFLVAVADGETVGGKSGRHAPHAFVAGTVEYHNRRAGLKGQHHLTP